MSIKRIAVNVTATYVQNAVSIVVGLFAARWVYLALGEERFGLFSLVGSLIAFVGIFNSLMTNSNARFFAIAIGEGRRAGAEVGKTELRKWFNTAFSVHVAMAVTLCLLMYPVGLYFIRNKLSIPDGLLTSSVWVFRISIVTTFFAILNIPFHSLYTAKQLIFVRNLFGILQTLLCAAEGWWLLHYTGNRLIAHSAVTSLILIGLYGGMAALAFRSFPECRLRVSDWYDRGRLKALFSYSSFTLFGSLGGLLSGPGVNIVLNMFFGPSINAVLGIGRQIASKVNMLSEAIVSAVSPEVTSRFGADDMKRAQSLGLDICYLSAVISILVFVPILMWLPELLVLWLKTPPAGAAAVSMIMILESIILKITVGYQMMIHASGKIKVYQMVLGTLNMSCIGVLWLLLWLGYAPIPSLAIAWLVPRSLLSMGRVFFARKILAMPIRLFTWRVFLPVFFLASLSSLVCLVLRRVSDNVFIGGSLCLLGNAFTVMPFAYLLLGKEGRIKVSGLYFRQRSCKKGGRMIASLLPDESKCSGCGACRNICPTGAIKLQPDSCGFVYPQIDQRKCTKCGLCLRVCPYKPGSFSLVRENASVFPSEMFAIQVKDEALLNRVSSGGAAALFVSSTIQNGGVAFGAVFDSMFQVSHQRAADEQTALRFCKSKYVQSDTGLTFHQVKEDLGRGRKVVYVGCPCQISGLYGYLGRKDPNLLTVDFICRGVPSQQLFNDYLDMLKKVLGDVVFVDFREHSGFYQKPSLRISGTQLSETRKHSCDPYMRFFHGNYSIRPSCGNCIFRGFPRQSDITVADFWDIQQADFSGNILNGVSRVFVNTETGSLFFNANRSLFHLMEFPFGDAQAFRFSMRLVMPIDRRTFLRHLRHDSFAKLASTYPTRAERLNRAIRTYFLRVLGWAKSRIRKGFQ